jgi:nucleotide-binding universal stress UspA family protein
MYPVEVIRGLVDDAEAGMTAAVAEAKKLGASRVSSRIIDGQPWAKVVECAELDPAIDLVVIGTHGRTGLSRVFLGSVAEMVVRHAPCSVLAIPKGGGTAPFARVLCAIDFSPSSRQALELAVGLARAPKASATLLHVIEPPRLYAEEPVALEVDPGLGARSQQLLEQWGADLAKKYPVAVASRVRLGRAGTQILAMVGEENAFDLIALGSHGRTGISRMLMGSVAERVVRHAGRPVLVARAR